jgi:hypothetical protein
MGITDEVTATIVVPAEYLEDARRALAVEIRDDSAALRDPSERESSARILRRDVRLLDQLLAATEDTTVEAEKDRISDPIADMLGEMVRVLSKRLEVVRRYGPVPMGDVLDIAERLRWAAEEAIRVEPDVNHRLSDDDLRRGLSDSEAA